MIHKELVARFQNKWHLRRLTYNTFKEIWIIKVVLIYSLCLNLIIHVFAKGGYKHMISMINTL